MDNNEEQNFIVIGGKRVSRVRQYLVSDGLKHRVQQKGPSISGVIKVETGCGDRVKISDCKPNNY